MSHIYTELPNRALGECCASVGCVSWGCSAYSVLVPLQALLRGGPTDLLAEATLEPTRRHNTTQCEMPIKASKHARQHMRNDT